MKAAPAAFMNVLLSKLPLTQGLSSHHSEAQGLRRDVAGAIPGVHMEHVAARARQAQLRALTHRVRLVGTAADGRLPLDDAGGVRAGDLDLQRGADLVPARL